MDIQEIPKNAERGELPPVRMNTVLIWIGFDQEPARDSVYKGYQEISKIVTLASGCIEQSDDHPPCMVCNMLKVPHGQ